ncbi:MAG: class I SAM-dependent methyltransferase [Rhodothermales bacterium]
MRVSSLRSFGWLGLVLLLWAGLLGCPSPDAGDGYLYREVQHPEGTGKFYLGREIATLSVNQDTAWHRRPTREDAELPERVIRAMDLHPNDVIADIGAGAGFFTFRLSPVVSRGKVLAVDIDAEVLAQLETMADSLGLDNIETVVGTPENPNLADETVDAALIVASYTEFSHPREMMAHIVQALKPGGRLILVEYRGEDATLPVASVRRLTQDQAQREMQAAGLKLRETKEILPLQHFMVFEKPVA